MLSVPPSTHSIDTNWLTEALRVKAGLHSEVTAVTVETIGEGVGLMGELARLHLTYAAEESLPATIVAKCAAQNENRQVAQVLDFYNREANFYNKVAPECPLRIPESYYSDVHQETYDFILLMEDLGDVLPPDQLVGASADEVHRSIDNIAGLHAHWWGATETSHPWMYDQMSVAEAGKLKTMVYQPALEPALEKFDYLFTEQTKAIMRNVGDRYEEAWALHLMPVDTFLHGDYRQDNMLYIDDGGDPLVMDWQISGRGKGIFDVAYFMCQSVDVSLRGEIESEVLEFYVGRLSDQGIDYPLERCLEDYRRLLLGCLIYPLTICGSLDTANERGRILGETMMSRNLAAIEAHGSAQLLS